MAGALNEQAEVDTDFIRELLQIAHPMQVTFHRAFDLCPDLPRALDDLLSCGVHRVLTSGGQPNALMGKESILQLQIQSRQRIIILPGGGLTPANVREFAGFTGVSELHFSARELVSSPMKTKPRVSLYTEGQISDLQWYECSSQKIAAIQKEISGLPE